AVGVELPALCLEFSRPRLDLRLRFPELLDLRLHRASDVRGRNPLGPRLVRHGHPRTAGGVCDSGYISSGVAVSASETSPLWREGGPCGPGFVNPPCPTNVRHL